MGADRSRLRRRHYEPIRRRLDVLDGAMTDVDVRMFLELPPPAAPQVRRLHAIVAEQPADALGHGVRRPVVVDHEHAPVRPTQHERRAQARGPAADDRGVVRSAAPSIEVRGPDGHASRDATIAGTHPVPTKSGG